MYIKHQNDGLQKKKKIKREKQKFSLLKNETSTL